MDVGSGWFLENKLILWDLFCLVIFIKIKKKKQVRLVCVKSAM